MGVRMNDDEVVPYTSLVNRSRNVDTDRTYNPALGNDMCTYKGRFLLIKPCPLAWKRMRLFGMNEVKLR